MKKIIKTISLFLSLILLFCSCAPNVQKIPSKSSSFRIQFIDVGQGDATLIECDGHYMLIDGGDISAGKKMYRTLMDNGVNHLDILAISHLHKDHIGGLIKALSYATEIDKTICNSDDANNDTFLDLERELRINNSEILIPNVGEKYNLGSAVVEVVDVSATESNDSLVLLVTYGKNRFLFTGDIEDVAQTRISDKYENKGDKAFKIDLIKMPHHGSSSPRSYNGTGSLYRFLRTFMPDYAVISVGNDNIYGHPHKATLDLLDDLGANIYRTDVDGDIFVKSDGENLTFETSK